MKKSTLTLTLLLAGGIAHADSLPHAAWQSRSADDSVSCAAIGCQQGDYERYPEYAPSPMQDQDQRRVSPGYMQMQPRLADPRREVVEEVVPVDATSELLRRLKHEDFESQRRVEPRPVVEVVPASEDAARRQFYKALRDHADGSGTLGDVEGAYQHLLPYRR